MFGLGSRFPFSSLYFVVSVLPGYFLLSLKPSCFRVATPNFLLCLTQLQLSWLPCRISSGACTALAHPLPQHMPP